MPVDMYVGGPEHACMHLLYARFVHKVLVDDPTSEPFKRLVHQGLITKDGAKMSKSKGNVVSPDQFVEKYGSDIFRMYLMFMGPFTEGGDWSDKGITGIARFVEKFYTLMTAPSVMSSDQDSQKDPAKKQELDRQVHKTIKKVTEDIEKLQFNTAIAALMQFVNNVTQIGMDAESKRVMTILIAPLAPHLAEEIWEMNNGDFSIFNQTWPKFDPALIVENILKLPIQVNGKLRGQIEIAADAAAAQVLEAARTEENVAKYLAGGKILKEIYVPGRMVNFVVGNS